MNTENFLKNAISEKAIKNKQLSCLREKETEFIRKESEINDLLKKTQSDYDNCIRANLAGNASDEELRKFKNNLKGLSDSLQEVKENIKILTETKVKLNREISDISGDLSVHREIFCNNLSNSFFVDLLKEKKLYQRLVDGYAAFCKSTSLIKSWEVYLSKCFEYPPEEAMRLAEDKLKQTNELLRD